MARLTPSARTLLLSAALLAIILQSGCASYSRRMNRAMEHVYTAQYGSAFDEIDSLVRRAEAGKRPERFDLPLLLLERASLAQVVGDHEQAIADLRDADQMLELLDLTPDGFAATARYLFSDDLTLYRPPIYEKLLVNLMAAASYLHLEDYRAAGVEARRARVMVDFFRQGELADHPMIAAAYYLMGIAAELNGERTEALGFYEAAARRAELPGLQEAIRNLQRPRRERRAQTDGEIIVILFAGLGPRRVPEHVPIGAAFAWIATAGWDPITSDDRRRYNEFVARGLLTWVNFPVLQQHHNLMRNYQLIMNNRRGPSHQVRIPIIADIEGFAVQEWESQRGMIAAAAITRAITRIAAREAATAAGRAAGLDDRLFPGASLLAGLAIQGTMQLMDRPDTRNWTTLPATLRIARVRVPAGSYNLSVRPVSANTAASRAVEVPAGGQRVLFVRAIQ